MPVARATDPRVITIEGQKVLVVETNPPIPPTLELLLEGGRDTAGRYWSALRVISRTPLHLGGARSACLADDHRLIAWLEGFHTGSDGVARHLRIRSCADCGAVEIRDITVDSMPGLRPGRLAPRRRDHVIGWYSGARPSQRTYGRSS